MQGKVKEVERNDLQSLCHKRQRMDNPPVSPGSSQKISRSASPKETFKRRTRHKTREDRYDANKTYEKSRPRDCKKKKTATTKSRRKVSKGTGGDIMEKFSSKDVWKSRLTVRLVVLTDQCPNCSR